MASIIGEVRIEPAKARPGETVTVEVFDINGESLHGRDDVVTYIDGVPGAKRRLQYHAKGERGVSTRVVGAAGEDKRASTVEISGEPLMFTPPGSSGTQRLPALLHVEQSPTNPYRLRFTIGEHPRRGRKPQPGNRRFAPRLVATRSVELFDADAGSLTARLGEALREADLRVNPSRLAGTVRATTSGPDRDSVLRNITGTLATPIEARDFVPRPREERPVATVDVVSAIVMGLDVGDLLDLDDDNEMEWDFGDGHTLKTRSLEVEHDFSRDLEPDQPVLTYDVKCRVDGIEVTRTLTIHTAYGIAKETGVLSPPVSSAIYATKAASGFAAQMNVSNIEHEAITLTHRAITPLTDDPDELQTPTMVRMRQPIVIAARSDSAIGTFASFGAELPWDAAGFDVHFAGTSASGTRVRFGRTFEIPLRDRWWAPARMDDAADSVVVAWPWVRIADTITAVSTTVATSSLEANVLADDGSIIVNGALHELRLAEGQAGRAARTIIETGVALDKDQLVAAASVGRLVRTGSRRLSPATGGHRLRPIGREDSEFGAVTMALAAEPPPHPGPVLEGQICDPDNLTAEQLTEADAGQLVCQRTEEEIEALMPGRFMNARKGDIILSPGGPGLVGSLLRRVTPAQRYSHSGIMTRNYDEVTHSTASEDRIRDYLVGWTSDGSDGIRPDVIRWMWPGVVAQPVEAAVNGEPWTDPENGKQYSISSFSAHAVGVSDNDNFVIVPPMVVKPDPMLETPAIRSELHAVAAAARGEAARPDTPIKSHYRLFCYTDPTIGETDTAPAEAGWAEGTFPSVCSSFIWMMAKRRGAKLESDQPNVMPGELEPEDVAAGAEVMPTTPDGLYRYTAAERRAAGQWLYDELYNEAHEEAGWFGVLLTDAADDLASEVVNTFAMDDPDKDSDAWEETGDANAVSPDNILWWDGPELGGLYGYAEPLIYREPRVEYYTISRWKKEIKRSDVTGRVTMEGNPVAGAMVTAYEGKTDFTDGDGRYALDDLPIGAYRIRASRVIGGIYHSVDKNVTLAAESAVVDLVLEPPEERYRLVKVFFDFDGREDEDWPWSDETTNPGPEYREKELGPQRLTNQFTRSYKWGGEARAEYTFDLSLLVDNSVRVQVRCLLYEGTSENTNDLDGQGVASFIVPMDQTGATVLLVRNTAEDEPDTFGRMAVTVENARNNN